MDKAVQKFIIYLEDRQQKIESMMNNDYNKILKKCNNFLDFENALTIANYKIADDYIANGMAKESYNIEYILEILKQPKSEWDKYYRTFVDFDILSVFVIDSDLNARERLNVIQYMIEKNLFNCTETTVLFDYEELKDLKFSGMTEKEFEDFILGKNFDKIVRADAKDLTKEELGLREQLAKRIKEKEKEIQNPFVVAQKIIKRRFLNKRNSFDEKDLAITLKAFKIIGVDPQLCVLFEYLLNREIATRKSYDKELSNVPLNVQKEEMISISPKEYNKIFREIETYYDIQNQKVTKPLSLKDIIYLVSLLYKINIQESEIIKCIKNINKAGYSMHTNPLSHFNEYYNKMLSCSENVEVKNAIINISEYLQEMFIPEKPNDYYFWKEAIAEELKNAMPIINQDYSFELEEGKKLNKSS